MYRANIGTFAQIMKRNQMEDTKHIKISEYNYPLPDERIAKFPLAVRDQSKLLVYRHGEVSEDTFTALPEYLEQGELMIFNNTKVIQARLHFRKETGADTAERLCTVLPANEKMQLALHDWQSEEMERRSTEPHGRRERETGDTDCHTQ